MIKLKSPAEWQGIFYVGQDRTATERNYVAEATRRRRRILQAGFFYRISNLTSKKFKKLVIEIMTHFAYDNFNILMRQYIKNLIVRIKQAIWLIEWAFYQII